MGVGGHDQRRGSAATVAFVTRPYVEKNVVIVNGETHAGQLFEPPAGAHLGMRGDEQLNLRMRSDDGTDVTSVKHGTTGLVGEVTLAVE